MTDVTPLGYDERSQVENLWPTVSFFQAGGELVALSADGRKADPASVPDLVE